MKEQTEILFELTGYRNVMVEGERKLPRGRDKLFIGEPDLLLVGLRSRNNAVESLKATESARVAGRERRVSQRGHRAAHDIRYIVAHPRIDIVGIILVECLMPVTGIGIVAVVNPVSRHIERKLLERAVEALSEIQLNIVLPRGWPQGLVLLFCHRCQWAPKASPR